MAQATGANGELRVGVEASFGVPATSMKKYPFIPNFSLIGKKEEIENPIMQNDRDKKKAYSGLEKADSSISVPIDADLITFWLKNVLGTQVTVDDGAGNYTHTFTKNNVDIPSLTIEKAHTDISSYDLGTGFKIDGFSLSTGGGNVPQLDLSLNGKTVPNNATEHLTPTDAVLGELYNPFQATLAGATDVTDVTLNFTNGLQTDLYTLDNGATVGSIPLGVVGVSGTFSALYASRELLVKAEARTTTPLDILYQISATKSVEFKMQECVLTTDDNGSIESPAGIKLGFTYSAFLDVGALGSALAVIVKNQQAT